MSNYNTENIDKESGEQTDEYAQFNIGAGNSIDLHLPKLEDVGHPMVPEDKGNYRLREINGTTDLELLSYVVNDPDYFAMLEGEAGVGKNMSIDVLCANANWPRVRVNFGVGTTYQNLVGRYAPAGDEDTVDQAVSRDEAVQTTAERIQANNELPDDNLAYQRAKDVLPESGTFVWQDGILTQAVKNGWMFVADEINAADTEAILPLNGVTENQDDRYLTIEEKSEVITPDSRFKFIATRNPVTYSGVSEMNSALESRSYVIQYDYHDSKALQEIISDNSNIVQNESQEALESLVQLAQDIRQQEQSGNSVVTSISSRSLIKVGRLTDIMDIREAVKTVFLGLADPTDEQSIKEMVETQRFQ